MVTLDTQKEYIRYMKKLKADALLKEVTFHHTSILAKVQVLQHKEVLAVIGFCTLNGLRLDIVPSSDSNGNYVLVHLKDRPMSYESRI